MALNVLQQLELMSGELKPPSVSLAVLVHQCAFITAKNLYDDLKAPSEDADAESYKQKMTNLARKVLRNEPGIVPALQRIVSTIIGESAFTYQQVSQASDLDWAGFILDQMDEA